MSRFISIKNARHHNLRGIDVNIPLDSITVITGPSGSGKSTLAMDILFAEGQRRYIEALGIGAEARIKIMERPEVDEISSIPPAVALEQRSFNRNPKSTVSTFTGIARLIRLLFANFAEFYCPKCSIPLKASSVEEITDSLLKLKQGTRLSILSPLDSSRFKNMPPKKMAAYLQSKGFTRILFEDSPVYLEDMPLKFPEETMPLLLVDRIIVKDGILSRLTDSVRLALEYGEGVVKALVQKDKNSAPIIYSWTSSVICPECRKRFPEISIDAFNPRHPDGACDICNGKGCQECRFTGVTQFILNSQFRSLKFLDSLSMTVENALKWYIKLAKHQHESTTDKNNTPLLHVITSNLIDSLSSLTDMGLKDISLDRPVITLSGGEFQKLRITSLVAKDITGTLFVLDEPSAGISMDDYPVLWKHISRLKSMGNSVVMVEHLPWFIKRADYVVELGPGAGEQGGVLLFHGKPSELCLSKKSITAPWLLEREAKKKKENIELSRGKMIVSDISKNHICIDKIILPLHSVVCITGPSGSGKTTILNEIYNVLKDENKKKSPKIEIDGSDIPAAVIIDAAPPGSNSAAMPATYLGIFSTIRQLVAKTASARTRGISSSYFLLNRKGGRCEACKGIGFNTFQLDYLPSVRSTCSICNGRRYNRDARSIKYRGKSMADILEMTAEQAGTFFSRFPSIRRPLELLERTGLGYLTLGQPLSTLSGGEAQRLKLTRELGHKEKGHLIFLMDMPLKGLHPVDVVYFIDLLKDIIQNGHSVVVVEHRSQMLDASDHVITLEKIP